MTWVPLRHQLDTIYITHTVYLGILFDGNPNRRWEVEPALALVHRGWNIWHQWPIGHTKSSWLLNLARYKRQQQQTWRLCLFGYGVGDIFCSCCWCLVTCRPAWPLDDKLHMPFRSMCQKQNSACSGQFDYFSSIYILALIKKLCTPLNMLLSSTS